MSCALKRPVACHATAEARASREQLTAALDAIRARDAARGPATRRAADEAAAALRDERDARHGEMRTLAATVSARLDELQASIDDERIARLEREGKLLDKVGRDMLRLHERVDGADAQRKTAVAELTRVCADASATARGAMSSAVSCAPDTDAAKPSVEEARAAKQAEQERMRFSAVVLEEIAALKRAVETEAERRVAEDASIVAVVNEYGRALRDGLNIVTASAGGTIASAASGGEPASGAGESSS